MLDSLAMSPNFTDFVAFGIIRVGGAMGTGIAITEQAMPRESREN